jgi:cytochrome c556
MQATDREIDRTGALAEVAKVRETAQKLANGDYPEQADHVRVLAGLIGQLAEQVERMSPQGDMRPQGEERSSAVATLEEDATPEEAPAEPLDDRAR